MKLLIAATVSIFLISGTQVQASLEHRSDFENTPSEKRLSVARGCFRQMKELGCGHPRDGQENFERCLQSERKVLSINCQKFFARLYGEEDP